jgi:hypothetical protein
MSDGIPRSIKPRDTSKPPAWLPLIVADTQNRVVLIERTGEIFPQDELATLLLSEPDSYIIAPHASELVAELDTKLSKFDAWQYKVSAVERSIGPHRPDRKRRKVTVDSMVHVCGFTGRAQKKRGRWFHPVDPVLFCSRSMGEILGVDGLLLDRLILWGRDVREFCQHHHLRMAPTGGGIAAQLLRDPRFYPDARRKVPRATNALARDFLPGNFYKLYGEVGTTYKSATYLDLKSAHHQAAAVLRFPHSDHLMMRGGWATTDPTDTTVPVGAARVKPGDPLFDNLVTKFLGLLRVRLSVPEVPAHLFPPPHLETSGVVSAFIYTNEIATINALGAEIVGVDAWWGSFKRDDGLNRYAVWCLSENGTMSARRRAWAKPTLLSTYGILAAKPKPMEFGYRRSKGGKDGVYPAGSSKLPAKIITLGNREIPTANVIHRGMIEAWTRDEALSMARTMYGMGHEVLSIYADAIIINQSKELALIPRPWEIKDHLHGLVFWNATSFHSRELTRLPGIPSEGRDRLARLDQMRRLATRP